MVKKQKKNQQTKEEQIGNKNVRAYEDRNRKERNMS